MAVLTLTFIIESISTGTHYVHTDCKLFCGQIILGNGDGGNNGNGGNDGDGDDGN